MSRSGAGDLNRDVTSREKPNMSKDDPPLKVTRATLEKIAVYANHPLKRILPDDTWAALQIGDEDLISLAAGLQNIARQYKPKARVTRSDISNDDVRDTVKVVLDRAGLGKITDADADNLIATAKAL
jgi:hypothetical protein